jgi:hypothetical protein
MFLYEEYFKRHNLLDVPLVRHCQKGSLIFCEDFKKNYILDIAWQNHDYHPGEYIITICEPVRNSYFLEDKFSNFSFISKDWDEYEDYFLNWNKNISLNSLPIMNPTETILACWRMFVCIYEEWFSFQDAHLSQILNKSLNVKRSLEFRYKNYQSYIDFLSHNYPEVLESWENDVLCRIKNYSYDLATAINQQNKLQFLQ